MNKTKQEMLEHLEGLQILLDQKHADKDVYLSSVDTLRTLITDNIIVSEEELEGMRCKTRPNTEHLDNEYNGWNAAIDKVKGMGDGRSY